VTAERKFEMKEKTLWVVNYDSLDWFIERATFVNASAVAIRTDNNLVRAIPAFHEKNIKVFGWRWPSAKRDAAMKEADKAADLLANHGLDGYYVDPEGAPGKPYDWDQSGLDRLAKDFCHTVTAAAAGKPFGITSHYRGKKTFAKLPWASFFQFSTVFLPQAYWRSDEGVIGHGIPEDNYRASIVFWTQTGAPEDKLVPMAGELAHATAAEIAAYAQAAEAKGISSLHFYAAEERVKDSVWNAVAQA
jgi:hypothetical protein